jgi:hypothetical protein
MVYIVRIGVRETIDRLTKDINTLIFMTFIEQKFKNMQYHSY